jgi:alpha/beta superfamily hydrolase
VVQVALGVIAVAVLDDAFVHPEPGTSIIDHLASGLVPDAVTLALAVAYPSQRPGVRAVIGFVCGSLAIVAGVVDGLRHVLIDRLSGDDATALLALAAGALLVALGTVVLWRSRRLDEPPLRRYRRRALIAFAALVATYFVALPVAIAVVVNHKARAPVAAAELGRPYRAVTLNTSDGLTLAGWYVPSQNRAAVIVFPGRNGPIPHARMLARHGYGVLLLDRRGEGASQGDYNARGWGGEPDLEAAVAYLARRSDVDPRRIGGLGLSVGGELLIQAAARDPRLKAVVSEGAGRQSLADQVELPDVPSPLRVFSPMTVETLAGVVLSNHEPPTGLATVIRRVAPRRVLLITGGHGNPDEELNAVYQAAGGPTVSLWEIPEATHTGGLAAEPGEYEQRVVDFFDSALLP